MFVIGDLFLVVDQTFNLPHLSDYTQVSRLAPALGIDSAAVTTVARADVRQMPAQRLSPGIPHWRSSKSSERMKPSSVHPPKCIRETFVATPVGEFPGVVSWHGKAKRLLVPFLSPFASKNPQIWSPVLAPMKTSKRHTHRECLIVYS
jgi:hypothetical protein